MWLSAIKLAVQAGSHIYKKKKQTQMLMADAQMRHAEQMSKGELEYKAKIIESMIMVGKTNLSWFSYLCLFFYWVGLFFLTIQRFVIN